MAARSIGRATALAAANAGWDVAINYRERADAADEVAAEGAPAVRALGRTAVTAQGRCRARADIVELFRKTEDALGAIRALVNSAGIANHILGAKID